jgi:phospholipase D
MAYSFTSKPIAEALVTAHTRGVKVHILIDKSQLKEKHSQLSYLGQNGLSVFIDSAQGIAHNKVMIFDDRFVLTGSFNFSKAAESRNAENIVIIDDPTLADIYRKNWEGRRENASPYSKD